MNSNGIVRNGTQYYQIISIDYLIVQERTKEAFLLTDKINIKFYRYNFKNLNIIHVYNLQDANISKFDRFASCKTKMWPCYL